MAGSVTISGKKSLKIAGLSLATTIRTVARCVGVWRVAHLRIAPFPWGVPHPCVFCKGGRRCCRRNFCPFYTTRCGCRRRTRPSQSTRRTVHPQLWSLQFEGRATRPDLQQKHTQLEEFTWQAFVSFHQTTRATSLIAEPAWLRPRGEMQLTCLAPSHCVAAGTSECRQK